MCTLVHERRSQRSIRQKAPQASSGGMVNAGATRHKT